AAPAGVRDRRRRARPGPEREIARGAGGGPRAPRPPPPGHPRGGAGPPRGERSLGRWLVRVRGRRARPDRACEPRGDGHRAGPGDPPRASLLSHARARGGSGPGRPGRGRSRVLRRARNEGQTKLTLPAAACYGSRFPMAPSLSIFFPAYNDAGTIASLALIAHMTARQLTD